MGTPALTRAYAALWLATAAAAAAVATAPGAAGAVRSALRFDPRPRRGTLGDAIDIASTNARVAATLLAASVAVAAAPAVRHAFDIVVAVVTAGNTAVVGAAIGAYGAEALRWLPHLPLEWAALAGALAVYLRARLTGCQPGWCVAATVLALLGGAAGTEVYLTPQN